MTQPTGISMNKPLVWTIAGFDPAGLAGVQADLYTLKSFNVDACSIITAVTAQNAHTVTAVEYLDSDQVLAQCDALKKDFPPIAIKIGMLGTPSTVDKIAQFLSNYHGLVVLDPVLASTSGTSLIKSRLDLYLSSLKKLLPCVDLITPNLIEAQKLLNYSLNSYPDIEQAAQELLALGAKTVLLKGGHAQDNLFSQDYWTNGQEAFWLANCRASPQNYRGTGCALSAAIAACLALGYSIKDALVIAKMYVQRGIRQALTLDQDSAKLFHGSWPEEQVDLPYLSAQPLQQKPKPFQPCRTGFYPIVDGSDWVAKLLPHGVKSIQLRIKQAEPINLEQEIKRSVALAKHYGAKLFINDYWELAIRYGATGIHLGQEDLRKADLEQIHQVGLLLGVSTHCYYEVAAAHAVNPSYIACGPIYPTTSKLMPFAPQGIEYLQRWRRTLDYPLVAIGGINLARIAEVQQTGIDGIALISAISQTDRVAEVTQQFLKETNNNSMKFKTIFPINSDCLIVLL